MARTELHRNFSDQRSREWMDQERIEYLQLRLSSKHPKTGICDVHAELDAYGLEPGIYPKAKAPQPPFHPHCFCLTAPFIDLNPKLKPRFNPNAERAFLASLPPNEARQIAGSRAKLERALKGGESLEDIYNDGKDELYRWKRVGDVGQDAGMSNDDNDFLEGRSRTRGELPKQAKPTEPGTLPADQLSKLEGDARAYVLGNGQKTGHEHMAALDLQTGKRLAQGTSNEPGRVYIPAELTKIANDPTRKIAYHHDHPDGFSLSAGDLRVMAKRPGLYEVVAYGHDGSRFMARRRDVHDLESMLDVAKIELRHQSQWATQRGLSLQGLEAHITNLALQQAGLIDYEFELDPVRDQFFQQEKSALNRIVAALAARIKQMRTKS